VASSPTSSSALSLLLAAELLASTGYITSLRRHNYSNYTLCIVHATTTQIHMPKTYNDAINQDFKLQNISHQSFTQFLVFLQITDHITDKKKAKVHPCIGTEAMYRPYGS